MTKRILIFSLMYDPFIGGAEVAIREITNRIDPEEYEFDLITLRLNRALPKYEKVGSVAIHRIGLTKHGASINSLSSWPLKINKFLYPLASYFKAIQLRMKYKYDGIWCMLAYHAALGAVLYKLTFPRTPYLLELQDGRSYEERRVMFGKLFWWLRLSFKKADHIKCISSFLLEIARRMGSNVEPVLIPNGVSVKHFSKQKDQKKLDALRDKIGLSKENTYVITTTRLVENRGLDAMIHGLKHLPKNVHYIICGTGPYKKNLELIAEHDGTQDRIVWAGHIEYMELPKYLAIADIFARPSIYEGMGNAFIEAMVAGLPTVATPVGGIIDFIFESPLNTHANGLQTGYLCIADDPISYVQAVKRVIDMPQHAQKVAAAGKKYASSGYEWNNIAIEQKKIFDAM